MSWASRRWLETVDDDVREETLRYLGRLREEWGDTFMEVLEIVSRHDPEGLLSGPLPPSEYVPEVRTIVPRLPAARSPEDVRRIVEEEFRRWFGTVHGPDGESRVNEGYRMRGGSFDLDAMAVEIWLAWQRGKGLPPKSDDRESSP